MKKKTKINKEVRLTALDIKKTNVIRREWFDMDYISKLSQEEYRWLAQFIDEYLCANITKHSNGRIKKGHLHKTKKLAKECYDNNNKRNNDLFTISQVNGLLDFISFLPGNSAETLDDEVRMVNHHLIEDAIIAEIDKKNLNKENIQKPIKRKTKKS